MQWQIGTHLESPHFVNSKNLVKFPFRFPRYFFKERFLVSIHAIYIHPQSWISSLEVILSSQNGKKLTYKRGKSWKFLSNIFYSPTTKSKTLSKIWIMLSKAVQHEWITSRQFPESSKMYSYSQYLVFWQTVQM